MNDNEHREIYNKFPAILRYKLMSGEITFPKGTQFVYESFLAYRGILREPSDCTPLNMNDMRSYFEQGKKPRGISNNNDPSLYSVSLFKELTAFSNAFKFPKPGKKVAKGYVFAEGGPQYGTETSSHVDWWLYEKVDLSGFIIQEDLNE